MGNRGGRFHEDRKALGARRFCSRRWIACECDFRGRRRDVWGKSYTELFFLDEVTALAAGHRPCFECRRKEAQDFSCAIGDGAPMPADEMDRILDRERRDRNATRLHVARLDDLPDGVVIVSEGRALAVRGDALLPWSFRGYGAPVPRPAGVTISMATPPSIARALHCGYSPRWTSC